MGAVTAGTAVPCLEGRLIPSFPSLSSPHRGRGSLNFIQEESKGVWIGQYPIRRGVVYPKLVQAPARPPVIVEPDGSTVKVISVYRTSKIDT
jgi:hypothetical protein